MSWKKRSPIEWNTDDVELWLLSLPNKFHIFRTIIVDIKHSNGKGLNKLNENEWISLHPNNDETLAKLLQKKFKKRIRNHSKTFLQCVCFYYILYYYVV